MSLALMPPSRRRLLGALLLSSLAGGSALAVEPLPLPRGAGMCAALQAYLKAGRLRDLESSALRGVQVAGRRANIEIRYEGTGLAPRAVVTDADSGEEFDSGLAGLDGEPRGDGAIVTWGALHHVLLLAREGKGGSTTALDGGPSCDIERAQDERVAAASEEPAVCRRLLSGDAPAEVAFDGPVAIPQAALAVRWNGDAGGVAAVGTARLDIANDGLPVDVVQLTTTLRQPDACTARLWDVLADHGRRLANETERRALAARGIVASDPAAGADCYSETHFLRDGRRVLVETLEHSQSDDADPSSRRVDAIEHGQLHGVCATEFSDDWRVTPATPGATH